MASEAGDVSVLDDDELERFCRAEQVRLVGALALYTGDRAVAEELAQDAFAKLVVHWDRVRTMGDRRAWLNRVAFNLAKSWFRRRAAERRAHSRRGADEQDASHPDSADAVAVRQAVASLPARQRTALVLRYYADLPVAEVADHMGCAEGTVKALTYKAIAALRGKHGLAELKEAVNEA